MMTLQPDIGETSEHYLSAELITWLTYEAQFGFARLEAALKQIEQQNEAASPKSQIRLKRDGTPDGRSLVTERPRLNDVKCEAVLVRGPFSQSSKPGNGRSLQNTSCVR